jgi:hypothetical protein
MAEFHPRSLLKGQCHEVFDFSFFHESVSPKPLSIPQGPFQIFFENLEIFTAQGALDTGGKWKKSTIRKVLIILFDRL